MKQRMAAHADHLGSIPAKEAAGCNADLRGMGNSAEADRTAAALVHQRPAKAEQAQIECGRELKQLIGRRVVRRTEVGDV